MIVCVFYQATPVSNTLFLQRFSIVFFVVRSQNSVVQKDQTKRYSEFFLSSPCDDSNSHISFLVTFIMKCHECDLIPLGRTMSLRSIKKWCYSYWFRWHQEGWWKCTETSRRYCWPYICCHWCKSLIIPVLPFWCLWPLALQFISFRSWCSGCWLWYRKRKRLLAG